MQKEAKLPPHLAFLPICMNGILRLHPGLGGGRGMGQGAGPGAQLHLWSPPSMFFPELSPPESLGETPLVGQAWRLLC